MRLIEQQVTFEDGVRCVIMPCCGFTFDAHHSDDKSDPQTWTCPLCQPPEGAVDLLREAWDYSDSDAPGWAEMNRRVKAALASPPTGGQ